jgi:phage/plasmid-associated DNA primase
MGADIFSDDPSFVKKLILLVQDLDQIAVDQRLTDNDAARNCASAASSLRRWLDELGLGPHIEPLA